MLTNMHACPGFYRLCYAWARDALMLAFSDAVRDELLKTDNARPAAHIDGDGPDATGVDCVGVAG